jgi:hypothetical protein
LGGGFVVYLAVLGIEFKTCLSPPLVLEAFFSLRIIKIWHIISVINVLEIKKIRI